MNDENTVKEEKKISKHEFYFETPLYESIKIENLSENILNDDVDAYSAKNKSETTYEISSARMTDIIYSKFYHYYKIALTCKRKGNDILRFFIYTDDNIIIKLGQEPSLADIQFAEIGKKYDKYLPQDEIKEFKKAIGLAAHGVGAGSFVYLRRVFENLIYETFNKHKSDIEISKEDFLTKRMVEKVDVLNKYLPSQLIEMKSIYSILSKGVHELSEQDCLKYFPALKLSIELILDQKIKIEEESKRDKAAKKQIEDINKNINTQNKPTNNETINAE